MFRVTTLDFLNPKIIAKAEDDFFGKPVFLTVSGQLEGETYACGLGKSIPLVQLSGPKTPIHPGILQSFGWSNPKLLLMI